ncbi:BCCT family transporter [Halococcus agarilyticus]|uniref:BCCT family transporter n=1 Tax=Halococcus agarilyticus TaxID=1232219 RepID=UPI000677EA37|nr:BCCT family transporter [Halococcus agarilyticus]
MASDESDQATGEMSDGLQVELFHPDSDRSPGDTNKQLLGGNFDIHPVVFPGALLLIVLFIAITLILGQEQATAVFDGTKTFIESTFGWFYLLAVNVFLITIVYFAISKYGSIRIGGVEAEKEFSTFSWMAMLFSAGMGIGLMFFSVTEPVVYFNSPPAFFGAEAGTAAAGTAAMAQTFFHWGLSPWAIYGLVGLGLAFFSFNRGLPLTFRSIFWPLLGDRIYGWPGHIIDLVSVFATLFGLCTSLGLGVAQVNSGFSYVGGDMLGIIDLSINTSVQVVLIAGITFIAVLSVAAGLDGGVKRLSTVNLYLMLILLGFLFIVGPTLFVLGTMAEGLGAYLGNFLALSFFTGTLGAGGAALDGTVSAWTVFYWGWWIAWSPFVGMFIARISKGRTVREFVLGVLVLPTLFSVVWLSTFGGSALATALQGSGSGPIMSAYSSMEYSTFETLGMFIMLEQYPLGAISGILATLLVITFFVTSSDSGSLVIDHLTSGGKHDVPRAQRVFWATTEGIVAAVLLWGGGLNGLQAAAISTGLPFAVILLVMCYTVYLGLDNEYTILESEAFREQIDQISDSDDVAVDRTGGDVVTGVADGRDTSND